MIINSISIKMGGENREQIFELGENLTVIPLPEFKEMFCYVANMLSYPVPGKKKKGKSKIREDTGIEVRKGLGPEGNAPLCEEYLSCKVYNKSNAKDYPLKLKRYLCYADEYKEKEFSYITSGLGETKTFRAYIHSFIKEFVPIAISKNKKIYLCIEKSGAITAKQKKGERYEAIKLEKKEETIFRFLSFLLVNKFWEGAMELRSYETPNMPLLAVDICAKTEGDPFKSQAIKQGVASLPQQVIVFTSLTNVPIMGHN